MQLNIGPLTPSIRRSRTRSRRETTAVAASPRSRLLLVVHVISLAILLLLGGGLAILASAHVSRAAVGPTASADRSLGQTIVSELGPAITHRTPSGVASADVKAVLERALSDVGLLGIALRTPDSAVRSAAAGDVDWPPISQSTSGRPRPPPRSVSDLRALDWSSHSLRWWTVRWWP